jgi:uncharacterized BrkB/YihY/UPF0761 family membrane protein
LFFMLLLYVSSTFILVCLALNCVIGIN